MKRDEKKRLTRNRLVEAALACFSEDGYERATVEGITKRAGVAKGTFFNYFQTKRDVLLHVGAIQEEWMVQKIERLLVEPGDSLADALIELMVATATRLPLSRPLVRAMFQASLSSPGEGEAQARHFAQVAIALVPLCELGQFRGELTKRLKAHEIAGLIMQAYAGALFAWALTTGEESLGQLVRRTFDALFNGLSEQDA